MMKMHIKYIFIGLLLIASFPLKADDDHDEAKRLVESGQILALEDILKKVRKIKPGKILDVELERKGDKNIYEIEVLDNKGTVIELKFDARTGQHLSTEEED